LALGQRIERQKSPNQRGGLKGDQPCCYVIAHRAHPAPAMPDRGQLPEGAAHVRHSSSTAPHSFLGTDAKSAPFQVDAEHQTARRRPANRKSAPRSFEPRLSPLEASPLVHRRIDKGDGFARACLLSKSSNE